MRIISLSSDIEDSKINSMELTVAKRRPRRLALLIGIPATALVITLCLEAIRDIIHPPSSPDHVLPVPKDDDKDEPVPIPALHIELPNSTDPQLQLLGQYEKRLSRGFDQMMLFRNIPLTVDDANKQAAAAAPILKEYARQGIKPLVIFEPTEVDLRSVDAAVFTAYFQALQANGIDNGSIGIWAPFPEPNIPEWSTGEDKGNTDPEIFKSNFTKAATSLKATFPEAKTVLLLNSATYQNHDVEYKQHASYDSEDLLKYAKGLPHNLADSACLQGFPWAPDAFDAGKFLKADLAIALGKELGVHDIRLNTGTFGRMHDTTVSAAQRSDILDDILQQARRIKRIGFNVTLDLFIENKYDAAENADWSYPVGPDWDTFWRFVDTAGRKGMNIIIFDQPPQE